MSEIDDGMFNAIRGVVNFSRYDEKYARLAKQHAARQSHFNENIARIAEENGVADADLRKAMAMLLTKNGAISAEQWAEEHAPTVGYARHSI